MKQEVFEAITALRNAAFLGTDEDREKMQRAVEVVAREIDAEPCSDVISRQAALDAICEQECNMPIKHCTLYSGHCRTTKVLIDLPSVHAEPRTGQSKSIPSGLKLKIEREADYQNERVNADIARGMYLALEIIDKWEADHA